MTSRCSGCLTELGWQDRDPNGDENATCARCRAEESHDFDAEPFVIFSRGGAVMEKARDYIAKNAKFHRGVYSVVLPNGRTVKSSDTYTLMQKAVREAECLKAQS